MSKEFDALDALTVTELDFGGRMIQCDLVHAISAPTERRWAALAVVAYLHERRDNRKAQIKPYMRMRPDELMAALGIAPDPDDLAQLEALEEARDALADPADPDNLDDLEPADLRAILEDAEDADQAAARLTDGTAGLVDPSTASVSANESADPAAMDPTAPTPASSLRGRGAPIPAPSGG